MSIDDILDDLRAQSGTTGLPTNDSGGENTVPDLRRHSLPCVLDCERDGLIRRVKTTTDSNRAVRGNFGDRIINQVVEH